MQQCGSRSPRAAWLPLTAVPPPRQLMHNMPLPASQSPRPHLVDQDVVPLQLLVHGRPNLLELPQPRLDALQLLVLPRLGLSPLLRGSRSAASATALQRHAACDDAQQH